LTDISRNRLCPCGSGRKYKHCCLNRRSEPATEELRIARRYHDAGNRLFADILAWATRKFGKRALTQALEEVLLGDDPGAEANLAMPWLVLHHPIEGRSPLEHYLAERGDRLSAEDRAVLETQRGAWLSVWEVTSIKPGEGLEIRDALTHESRFVHDANASRSVERWCLLLAYVEDHPGVSVLNGVHPSPLQPEEAEALLSDARQKLRVRTRPAPVERLRDPELAMTLIQNWELALFQREQRAAQPLRLQNTDGDTLLLTVDHFDITPGEQKEVTRRLEAMPLVSDVDDDGGVLRFACSKPGNAMHRSWTNTTVGVIELRGDRLRVETNSIARADALRREIEAALGALAKHRAREHTDPNVAMARAERSRGAATAPEAPPPPELQAVFRQYLDQHWAGWLDTQLPALDGLTPRAAAARPADRRRLVTLLKECEVREGRKPGHERYDMQKVWSALGIDPRTGEPPATARVTALEGGTGPAGGSSES